MLEFPFHVRKGKEIFIIFCLVNVHETKSITINHVFKEYLLIKEMSMMNVKENIKL